MTCHRCATGADTGIALRNEVSVSSAFSLVVSDILAGSSMWTKMASTEDVFVPPRDHSTPKHAPRIFGHENEVAKQERKSLQTLQRSAHDESALVGVGFPQSQSGRGEKNGEKCKQFKPVYGPVKVYCDKGSPSQKTHSQRKPSTETRETQTDDSLLEGWIQERMKQGEKRDHASVESEGEEEAFELMVKEPVPETYWREIAEQRRLALNDTLEENKSLHKEMQSLQEENEQLSELASQVEYLSSLLQSVVSDDEDEKEDNGDAKDMKLEHRGQQTSTPVSADDGGQPAASKTDASDGQETDKNTRTGERADSGKTHSHDLHGESGNDQQVADANGDVRMESEPQPNTK